MGFQFLRHGNDIDPALDEDRGVEKHGHVELPLAVKQAVRDKAANQRHIRAVAEPCVDEPGDGKELEHGEKARCSVRVDVPADQGVVAAGCLGGITGGLHQRGGGLEISVLPVVLGSIVLYGVFFDWVWD